MHSVGAILDFSFDIDTDQKIDGMTSIFRNRLNRNFGEYCNNKPSKENGECLEKSSAIIQPQYDG